ncbi:MAG: helix-turn-helix transcriptional regulator, partial [Acholeplasmataceae bacterium]|nr:helix-turn-helix transcriptional regulator [Acholeplasmataceae bacterium]
MINMIYYSKQFRKRRSEKPFEAKPIGSAIKMKRKELKMTLEESSEGICSISYLSKLENNLIEPNDLFVCQLRNRLNLKDEEEIDCKVYREDLDYLIECMLSGDTPNSDLIDKYLNHQDQQSLLIQICYSSLTGYKLAGLSYYEKIKVFIPNLDHLEAALLSLSLSIILYHKELYQIAYDVLKIGARHKIEIEALELLIMKWTLLSAFKMRRIKDMTNLYEKFISITTDKQYFQMLKVVNLEYYKLYSVYEEPEKTKLMMQTIRDFSKEEKDFIYARSLFTKKEYLKLYPIIKEYLDKDSEWFMVSLICLDGLKKEVELMKLIERAEKNKNLSDTCSILIKHIKVKYNNDKSELLRYLRNDVLNSRLPTD